MFVSVWLRFIVLLVVELINMFISSGVSKSLNMFDLVELYMVVGMLFLVMVVQVIEDDMVEGNMFRQMNLSVRFGGRIELGSNFSGRISKGKIVNVVVRMNRCNFYCLSLFRIVCGDSVVLCKKKRSVMVDVLSVFIRLVVVLVVGMMVVSVIVLIISSKKGLVFFKVMIFFV